MQTMHRQIQGLTRTTRRGNWLVGCGVVLAIVVILIVGVGVFVAVNLRGWAADGLDAALTAMIEDAPIDEVEKAETLAVADRFVQRVRDGDVGLADIEGIVRQLENSPLIPAGISMGVGKLYLDDSGLTDEQKADGRVQLSRMAFGFVGSDMNEDDIEEVFEPLRAKATDTDVIQVDLETVRIRIKDPEHTTDEEVLAFIEAVRTKADEKELPEEPPAFDLSGELEKVLGQAASEGP